MEHRVSDIRVDETDHGALRLRLDAPARRNALTLETVEHLHDILERHRTQTLLLGSTTTGIFSAGADLTIDDASRTVLSDLLYACYRHMVTRSGVVVTIVEGPAVGGGAQLAAASDLRVISASARWRWVGTGHGLAVGAWILPDLLGRARAFDLTMTSRWLEPEEAVLCGFATRIDTDPWQRAQDLARTLAAADRGALARVKQVATRTHLLDKLSMEREQNHQSWSGRISRTQQASSEGNGFANGLTDLEK
jgi:enoyl-CoA hydratase/carnithine racemase